ncbi:unnamed protein product [Polarella glacialis]|uniref:Uncharacterized protein n=1 Tax=Polarella glacialis TaxID=89957 RepID=A0A813JH18_POLGL|nr:unnamed protein product [Polarella glacialis]CAE8622318.1 unnamed protein product [Polarella glacialis]CAE8650743.1 unnamed protein product [Polarella glacialis]CAE8681629.1 unnamed protein product [Polarella glacialis]
MARTRPRPCGPMGHLRRTAVAAAAICLFWRELSLRLQPLFCNTSVRGLTARAAPCWEGRKVAIEMRGSQKRKEMTPEQYGADKQQLLNLFKLENESFWHWKQFSSEQGIAMKEKLKDVPEDAVRKFLDIHSKGALDHVELASPDALSKFSKLQKGDKAFSWHWENFCAQKAYGVALPQKLPAGLLQEFLDAFEAGSFGDVEMASDELAARVTAIRKAGGNHWETWVSEQALGNSLDPKRWTSEAVRAFLSQPGLPEADGEPLSKAESKAARRDSYSSEKQQLVRLFGEELAITWQWKEFCTGQGTSASAKVADVPESIVQQFVEMHSNGELPEVEMATTELVAKLDALRQEDYAATWHFENFCVDKAMGVRDPKRLPAATVEEFLSLYEAGSFPLVEMASDELAAQVDAVIKAKTIGVWQTFLSRLQLGNSWSAKRWPAETVRRFLKEHGA